jgi:hypothetical protein
VAKRKEFKPTHIEPGKWYVLDNPEETECCDCSLVHITEYKFDNKMRVIFRTRRDDKQTAIQREKYKIIVTRDITVE